MPENESSATVTVLGDWSMDGRGYIHGGFSTPIFMEVKRKHNARRTAERNKIKKSSNYGLDKKEN